MRVDIVNVDLLEKISFKKFSINFEPFECIVLTFDLNFSNNKKKMEVPSYPCNNEPSKIINKKNIFIVFWLFYDFDKIIF